MPRKNSRKLLGRPLISYAIDSARRAKIFSAIAVSSDSEEILNIAAGEGVQLLIQRPSELASDSAAKIPAIRHCLCEAEQRTSSRFDYIFDLDVTCPLRSEEDIVAGFEQLQHISCTNVVSGSLAAKSPYFNLVEYTSLGNLALSKTPEKAIVCRQDAPLCYALNGAVYGWRREVLIESDTLIQPNTKLVVMPELRSVDIDSEIDFLVVEQLLLRSAV